MSLPLSPSAYRYGARTSGEAHGVVQTKPQVVTLILDLVGYTVDKDLAAQVLLEPACGRGAFVLPAVERLLKSARNHQRDLGDLAPALRAFDIDLEQVVSTRAAATTLLVHNGLPLRQAQRLAAAWILHGDFLLAANVAPAHYVVGNPPYVRIEHLPPPLQAEYRRRYQSVYDRADLYVAFIERALQLLPSAGALCFICTDRWTRNRYGAPLRRLITDRYHLRCYIDLQEASPFESAVVAYPCIFVITAGQNLPAPWESAAECKAGVSAITMEHATPSECAAVLPRLRGEARPDDAPSDGVHLTHYPSWFGGEAPWILSTPTHLLALRELEERWAPLEQVGGTQIGIGVATGNDRLYIVDAHAPIEPDRLVPLVLRDDLQAGRIVASGRFVINTFRDDGRPIELAHYPRLAAYLTANETEIRRRHIAKKNPYAWFRTIDRVYPELARRPKLLVPDIAGANGLVFEPGGLHPHHNLYFVTAEKWDLEALGGLLSSKVALFFIWSYAVKMRGGYLRFQAQYLRRICLPPPELSPALLSDLQTAFRQRDFPALDELALTAYGLRTLPDFPFVDTRQ